ncbi:MAG TPA: SUMF1/EgtB/PvdO family nonheme iron enzyme [Verrucomicrobiae bacterium]|nr:SUMF1/EgtB/PvdO family nonheme iron enzyme [Verrucomicrobiae bacterium]
MKFSLLFTAALIAIWPLKNHAQTESDATASDDSDTNEVVTLKDLMASNNIVTNTIGVVLVKISPDYWVGKFEVTQDAYQKLIGSNPSAFSGGQNPVDSVSWNDAMDFCKKLTEKETKGKQLPVGYAYSLPTENQWEKLVADAALSDAVTSLPPNHHSSTAPVGSLGANSLGLYDTRGNVMEWCLDSNNPQMYKVLRGGAWDTAVEPSLRIQFRNYAQPGEKKNDYGFRIVLQSGSSQ